MNGDNAAPLYKFLKSSKSGFFGDSTPNSLLTKKETSVDRYSPITAPASMEVRIPPVSSPIVVPC